MNKIRILILEDDRDIIDLVASVLDEQYECYAASNGMDGIKLALLGEPDLIVCDIMMPVMDGWEFVRRLRKFGGFDKTPVIFLSALAGKDNIREGYNMGVGLYLTKPVEPARLRRVLDLFIEDHAIQGRPKKVGIEDLLLADLTRLDELLKGTQQTVSAGSDAAAPGVRPAPRRTPIITPPPVQSAPPNAEQTGGWSMPAPGAYHPPPAETDSQIRRRTSGASPIARSFMQRAAGMVAATQEATPRVRIMVVEDDRDTLQMMISGLGDQYELIEAGDGISAIEKATRLKPDLFIIDGVLPRMTGYQLTVMLRKNRDFFRSPIIFISGKATPRDQQYALKLGISRFFPKPFRIDILKGAIKQITEAGDFKIQSDRPAMSQAALQQVHVKETPADEPLPDVAELERRHLENVLKRQLH